MFHFKRKKTSNEKKKISILGDSISTLQGYIPPEYQCFYNDRISEHTGVSEKGDTWWGMVIDYLDGELLVNNSYSGSKVTVEPEISMHNTFNHHSVLYPSGCSNERTSNLHIKSQKPDIIIVYLGTNDWARGVKPYIETYLPDDSINCEYFDYSYEMMIKKLKSNYPESEIWCCSLSETYMSNNLNFKFPCNYGGVDIGEYNNIIRSISYRHGCRFIDLYSFMPYDTLDGSHPTKAGMKTLADAVINAYDCGFYHKYVEFDFEKTSFLHSNTLLLKCENEITYLTKNDVSVGSASYNDIVPDKNSGIQERHALFVYEYKAWFLVPSYFGGKTYLNGIELQAGNRYILAAEDVIKFGDSAVYIFYHSFNLLGHVKNNNDYEDYGERYHQSIIMGKYYLTDKYAHNKDDITDDYLVRNIEDNKMYQIEKIKKISYENTIYKRKITEIELLNKINCSAVPKIREVFDGEYSLWIVRKYESGKTIEHYMETNGVFEIKEVVNICRQICESLEYLHTMSPPIIHCDIRPSNILLKPDGTIMYRYLDSLLELKQGYKKNDFFPKYAAPEQISPNGIVDERTDIYLVGMTLGYMLFGSFNFVIEAVCNIPERNNMDNSICYDIVKCIAKCIAKNPLDRFQSIKELIHALDNIK